MVTLEERIAAQIELEKLMTERSVRDYQKDYQDTVDREMKITGIRVTPKGYYFKVNQLGVESTLTVSKALQSCLGL